MFEVLYIETLVMIIWLQMCVVKNYLDIEIGLEKSRYAKMWSVRATCGREGGQLKENIYRKETNIASNSTPHCILLHHITRAGWSAEAIISMPS
jgi:hypothetical protein